MMPTAPRWTTASAYRKRSHGGTSGFRRFLLRGRAKVGLECHLILRRVRGARDREIQGALLLDLIVGAHVQLIDDDRPAQTEALNELAATLEAGGRRVFRALLASEW